MDARTSSYETMLVLSDLFSDEVVDGWAIPRDAFGQFVADVEHAACKSGAVPFSQMDFLEFDNAVTSLIGMRFRDERTSVVRQAEEILNEA